LEADVATQRDSAREVAERKAAASRRGGGGGGKGVSATLEWRLVGRGGGARATSSRMSRGLWGGGACATFWRRTNTPDGGGGALSLELLMLNFQCNRGAKRGRGQEAG
jgi:hypothetical protein